MLFLYSFSEIICFRERACWEKQYCGNQKQGVVISFHIAFLVLFPLLDGFAQQICYIERTISTAL